MNKKTFFGILTGAMAPFSCAIDTPAGADNTADRKARKEKARILSMVREEELRLTPRPPRRKKRN